MNLTYIFGGPDPVVDAICSAPSTDPLLEKVAEILTHDSVIMQIASARLYDLGERDMARALSEAAKATASTAKACKP